MFPFADIELVQVSGTHSQLSGLEEDTLPDGNYELLLNVAGLQDRGGNPGVGSTLFTWAMDATPPTAVVQSNDGSAQRSTVTSITVTFSEIVTLDPKAFKLRQQDGTAVGILVHTTTVAGHTVATITFVGDGIIAGSLADGNYTLKLRSNRIRDAAGNALDGNEEGVAGGNLKARFFRPLGDSDGDRDVDKDDFERFRSSLGKSAEDPGFLWHFDYEGNGTVDHRTDLVQFNLRRRRR